MAHFIKSLFALFLVLTLGFQAAAQIISPPKWDFQLTKTQLKVGDEVEIVLKANIPRNWYIYSNDFDENVGPTLTTLSLKGSKGIKAEQGLLAIEPKKKFDDVWEAEVTYFTGNGEFRQKLKVTDTKGEIVGLVDYQMCSDVTGQCIPFEQEFKLSFVAEAGTAAVQEELPAVIQDSISENLTVDSDKIADLPEEKEMGAQLISAEPEEDTGLLGFMILAFLAGLAALLTPCVFPMIPMTVTFFTGRASSRAAGIRNAFIYGASIILIYTLAGTAVAAIQGPEFANWLSTHWIPNVFFFLVFIFFALAFLGMFELTLPSGLVNKIDAKADKGGLMGIFFMAFTLVLVSFSCTGPIVGSILISSAGGALVKPILGMFAFSLAFAIPFTLFAIFPEWLNSLPKSGGWLNSVKVVLGFLELALAFKFLSVADQVYHWGLLDREIYLAIWIAIFALLGLYLLGKLRLPHDSPMEYLGVPRLMLALTTFIFVIYLIPGLWGAPLKALSGYLPPLSGHDFNLMENRQVASSTSTETYTAKYSDFLHFPHGIQGYFDYQEALAAAKKEGKPLFIDFTGHGCVNCREMEARVWSDPQVLKRLKDDFVMVALYIDERMELPKEDWYVSTYDNKEKTTIGKQNADFQITRFNNNAQPFYVILDHEEQLLVKPKAYDTNIGAFVSFLEAAKEEFKNR